MRADRLIVELMLLQARGRMTARELANEVEVTERTIYRDIEALSISGVPVYAERGPGGGISLVESYRTTLTGLKRGEVRALFMLSIPAALAEMGLDEEAQTAFIKLSAALPSTLREEEQRTRQRFYIDPSGWQAARGPGLQSAAIQKAVWEDRLLRVRYLSILGKRVEPLEAEVEPYGLIARRGEWYLVCKRKGMNWVIRLDRIQAAELLSEHFIRILDFDLMAFWKEWLAEESAQPHLFRVKALAIPEILPLLADHLVDASSMQQYHSCDGDRKDIWLSFENFEQARSCLLGFGGAVEILEPKALRISIADYAKQIVSRYSGGRDD